MYFVSDGSVKGVSRYLRETDLTRHLKEESCTGGRTKIICLGSKLRHILNSKQEDFLLDFQHVSLVSQII